MRRSSETAAGQTWNVCSNTQFRALSMRNKRTAALAALKSCAARCAASNRHDGWTRVMREDHHEVLRRRVGRKMNHKYNVSNWLGSINLRCRGIRYSSRERPTVIAVLCWRRLLVRAEADSRNLPRPMMTFCRSVRVLDVQLRSYVILRLVSTLQFDGCA